MTSSSCHPRQNDLPAGRPNRDGVAHRTAVRQQVNVMHVTAEPGEIKSPEGALEVTTRCDLDHRTKARGQVRIQTRKEDRNLVSECANPKCHEPFIYFRQGKIFAVPRGASAVTRATIEYFWLCQRCAESMALEFHRGDRHPSLVSRRAAQVR